LQTDPHGRGACFQTPNPSNSGLSILVLRRDVLPLPILVPQGTVIAPDCLRNTNPGYTRGPRDVNHFSFYNQDLPTVDCDKAISVDLRYEDKLTDGSEAYLQCALLYTTVSGQRRIRVHTLAVPVSSVLGNVFRACDLETQTCSMIRKACGKLLTGNCSLQGAKDASLRTTVDTLYAYRKFCASNNSTGQLILPEGLKVLPLYCLAMHKSDGLRLDASADDR
jgi:hypothetical protein